jgi:hypothetical protein
MVTVCGKMGSAACHARLIGQCQWLRGEVGRLTTEQNSTRDVGARHQIARDLSLRQRELSNVERDLQCFVEVESATDTLAIGLNSIVTYRTEKIHVAQTVQIGEYGSSDAKAKPPIMSYDTNLLFLSMLGRKKGEAYELYLHTKKTMRVEIIDIRLPATQPDVKLTVESLAA